MAACKGGRGDPKALATTDAEDNPHKAQRRCTTEAPLLLSKGVGVLTQVLSQLAFRADAFVVRGVVLARD